MLPEIALFYFKNIMLLSFPNKLTNLVFGLLPTKLPIFCQNLGVGHSYYKDKLYLECYPMHLSDRIDLYGSLLEHLEYSSGIMQIVMAMIQPGH